MVELTDRWSLWVFDRRNAGDPEQQKINDAHQTSMRARILSEAGPLSGTTLMDVGVGDGRIGIDALDRVGSDGHVIFADHSAGILEHCRAAVAARGDLDRATFVETRAETLNGVPDASVDVITTRSVLIYVEDKLAALRAFYRALRPGGRISLFEPVNKLLFPEAPGLLMGYDVSAVADLAARIWASYFELQGPEADTMIDFDDRDLARLAEAAGFATIDVESHMQIEQGSILRSHSLNALLDTSPNPLAPTIRESMRHALSAAEQEQFLHHLGDAFAAGRAVRRRAFAYVVAQKDGPR